MNKRLEIEAFMMRSSMPSVTCMALFLGFTTCGLPAAVAAQSPAEAYEPPECDYDINADCRTRDQKAVEQSRAGAPVDLTGYWVSVVTEDWRWRMATPPKGDIASLPLNVEGERVTNLWDPAEGPNCKAFGAAGLMRNPMRVRIRWDDDHTLRVDTDHGMQTRYFYFDGEDIEAGEPTLQGDSVARWQESGLKVVTTNLEPAYLRKNGVPYSGDTVLTEYYDRLSAFGEDWLIVTTVVNDPEYLSREFITSTHFKALPDGSTWHPVPCGSGPNEAP